jgi:2-(1,2-epoxy-1,2-dihydrophenyl)acetyl-CoA isomerase
MFETPEDKLYLVDFQDGLLRLTFNRPEASNAMTPVMTPRLAQLFQDANGRARCILVRGEGKTFSAGGDVGVFSTSLEQDIPTRQADFTRRLTNLRNLVLAVAGFEGPLVVALRGGAAGAGLVFPLAADLVIADPTAFFAFAHQGVGLCPDGGVSALLPLAVGARKARSLVMTAARVKAEEAQRLGLIDRIVAPEELEEVAAKEAARFARGPRRAMRLAKKLVRESAERSLSDQLTAELEGVVSCVADPDFDEGVRAFLDKRAPAFPSAQDDG